VVDQSRNLKLSRIAATGFVSAGPALTRLAGRGVLVAALVAVFGLAGCGRKAGLDAPPMAVAGDQQAGQQGPAPAVGPDGKPIAPATDKRHSLFDWLIN
jgi:predicted small lipoprotein YifL